MMRIFSVVIIFLGLLIYLNQQKTGRINQSSDSLINQVLHPFDQTVHYRVGDVDPRFNLTTNQVIQLAQEAANIWQQTRPDQQLFKYDPSATLAINLIYDGRQSETNLRHAAQQDIQLQLADQQQQASQFKQQQQQLDQQRLQLAARQAAFKQQQANYNRTVEAWNTLGNADAVTRQQLEQQQQVLRNEQQNIQDAVARYNDFVELINRDANHLNRQADTINKTVDQYQHRFVAREFEKGVYNGKQINIYEFSSQDELRLAIAHELGHALGLGHNNDPYALMYPMMQQQDIKNFRLTASDQAMLMQR